jgi:hypothetical protein
MSVSSEMRDVKFLENGFSHLHSIVIIYTGRYILNVMDYFRTVQNSSI